ncbi:MFS transporter [Bacillota bacterium LX-D]|nr:MFS transporter [Bacillota bacterium LX-D]
MGSFLTPFISSAINIALPTIGTEFSTGALNLSWIATSYLLAAAVLLVPFGRLADIYGRKKIYFLGTLFFSISSALCSIAMSTEMLILFRILQGISAALIFSTGVAILTSVFNVGERGKALGINVAVVYIGLSLGPTLGGLLTYYFSWRSIFLVNMALGLITAILIIFYLKGEWVESAGEKFDLLGSILYASGILGVMYGFSILSEMKGIYLVLSGSIIFLIFFYYEFRISNPILNVSLFRKNRLFIFSSFAAFINYSATNAVGFLLSLYLQFIKTLTPQTAGVLLIIQPAIQALFSPLAGKLSDKIEPQKVASLGMVFTTLGLFTLIFLDMESSFLYIIMSLVFLGFGFSLFSSPNTNAVMSSVNKKYYGVASGILGTMRLTGQMFSMGIATFFIAMHIGKAQITPTYYPLFLISFKQIILILTILCFIGIFCSLARGKSYQGIGDISNEK